MKGTLVNTATVILGSSVGLLIGARFPERINTIVMHALGLATLLIGFRMAFKTGNILLVIWSLAIGGIIGELLKIEDGLERIGEFIKKKVKSESGSFVLGFVTSSLVFCLGPMTIVGSIQDGSEWRCQRFICQITFGWLRFPGIRLQPGGRRIVFLSDGSYLPGRVDPFRGSPVVFVKTRGFR